MWKDFDMIPFGILSGQIHMGDVQKEVRVLELAPDFFTFRLKNDVAEDDRCLWVIDLYFRFWGQQGYRKVTPGDLRVTEEERRKSFRVFRAETKDAAYREAAVRLTKEYMRYAEIKNTCGEYEFQEETCGYPRTEEETYGEGIEEVMKRFGEKVQKRGTDAFADRLQKNKEMTVGLALETPNQYEEYLEYNAGICLKRRLERYGLCTHPLFRTAEEDIRYLYVGNGYCPNLCPKEPVLRKICKKAAGEGKMVILVLPPVPESRFDEGLRTADVYREITENGKKPQILVNDYGMLNYLKERYRNEVTVSEGLLLQKRTADTRERYICKDAYLKADCTEGTVYLPWVRMNTGTFCPLHAAVTKGNRGNLSRVSECGEECAKYAFLYPEHLNMCGRYNSLFAFAVEEMSDGTCPERCERLVIV